MTGTIELLLAAWALEITIGWPDWLYSRIRHPVVWMGALINACERTLNRCHWLHTARYGAGVVTVLIVIAASIGSALVITILLPPTIWGFVLEAWVASSLLASRSLHQHVAAVAQALSKETLDAARVAVAHIVGRDVNVLDTADVARASLESLAENASDGVIAPLFWGLMLGLPGVAFYKAVNTLDSVIAHRSPRYAAFGGFAARLDDMANLIPARITALLFVLASGSPYSAWIMQRDHAKHRSPNAGWPEAAMAGALNVRLSGPRSYGGGITDDPWLNTDAPDPTSADIGRGLSIYRRAMMVAAGCLGVAVFARAL